MATQPRPKISLGAVNRSGNQTKFHIDFDWWENSELDLKAYLSSRLNIQGGVSLNPDTGKVDLVDPKTGEVRRVDGFQFVLQSYFRQLPEDFIKRASLVDAVFCVLLGNANHPMTAVDLAEKVKRSPDVVLRTLNGRTIYQGIRPILEV